MLNVFKPGTHVSFRTANKQPDGLIVDILIAPGLAVKYKVVWWSDGIRYEEWINEFEIDSQENNRISIGFG